MESLKDYMDKKAVAQVLEQIAAFLELKGENPFRIRAFRTAARAIGGFPGDLRSRLEDGSLAATKGVGPATLQIVAELVEHRPGQHAGGAAGADPARTGRDARDLRTRRGQDPPDPRGARHRLPAGAGGGRARRPPGQAAPFRPEDVGEHPQGDRLPAPGQRLPALASRGRGGRRPSRRRWSGFPVSSSAVVAGDVRRRRRGGRATSSSCWWPTSRRPSCSSA